MGDILVDMSQGLSICALKKKEKKKKKKIRATLLLYFKIIAHKKKKKKKKKKSKNGWFSHLRCCFVVFSQLDVDECVSSSLPL
jgi:hypothetical protein